MYRPGTPSLRRVWRRHWRGPENWVESEVCRRTLIVSKGCPTVVLVSCACIFSHFFLLISEVLATSQKLFVAREHGVKDLDANIPLSFAMPENTPATKPL